MSLIRVADFGSLALNTDVQPTMLQPGEWTTLQNIDLESNDIRSAWGDSLITGTPPCEPRYIYVFEAATDVWVVISDGTKIYAYNGSIYTDISPVEAGTTFTYLWNQVTEDPPNSLEALTGQTTWDGIAGDGYSWDGLRDAGGAPVAFDGAVTFDVFLGTLIACATGGTPVYWPGETGRMQPLPGWVENARAQMVVSYANALVAIGYDDGTVGAKYRVAWSDFAAEGEIPQSWSPTVPASSQAGSVQLRDTDGFLTTAKILRDDLVIFKQDSIYRMYQRGDELVMGFERVISDHGCDSSRGVANLNDMLFFADRGDLRAFDGQATKSIAAFKIKEQLTSAISNEFRDKTIVVAYPEMDQVLTGVVPAGQDEVSIVLVYDTLHTAWSTKVYSDVLDFTLGPFSATVQSVGKTWDDAVGSWDQQQDNWDSSFVTPTEDGIIFGSATAMWRMDRTNTDYLGNPKRCTAERSGFILAGMPQAAPSMSSKATLKRVYPEMVSSGAGSVQIQVGTQSAPNSGIDWTPTQDFRPGIDKRLAFRQTGQPTAFRISSNTDLYWRLAAVSFEVVEAGRR